MKIVHISAPKPERQKQLTARQQLHARSIVSLAYAKELSRKAAEKKFDKIKKAQSTSPCPKV